MSLTSLLQSPLHTNLTAWFKHHFPTQTVATSVPILVGKEVEAKLDYSLVGMAFDYLFRFQLERINATLPVKPHEWLAEHGLRQVLKSKKQHRTTELSARNTRLVSRLEDAKREHRVFIQNGIVTTELIESCLLLAKFDIVYRSGSTELDFEAEHRAETAHIRKLFAAVNWQRFQARQQCVLNPTFGRAGMLVGGADADVLIDGMLIDLKVTATLTPKRAYINQLIGYYLLSLIYTKDCAPIYPIHTVALYFPRADYLLTIPVAQYFDNEGFQQRKAEFIGLVRDMNLDLVNWDNNEYLFDDHSSVPYRVDRNNFKCPHCRAGQSDINAAGQTASGRYKYKCKACKKGFSTVFSAGLSMKSVIQSRLFEHRLLYEERDCLEKELREGWLTLQAKVEELKKQEKLRKNNSTT